MEKSTFRNTDRHIIEAMPRIIGERKTLGLEGLVTGLDHIVINTEPENQREAVAELLGFTGYDLDITYRTAKKTVCVLKLKDSADILVTSRHPGMNRFAEFNRAPRAAHLPNTRIEKFVFSVRDIDKYAEGQLARGARFDGGIVDLGGRRAIHTHPSRFHGLSFGFAEWASAERDFPGNAEEILDWDIPKPDRPHLRNIGFLDHTATRVNVTERDDAMLEFIGLTNYDFKFAIYVERLNSITSVSRHAEEAFAMVFTSGISPKPADGAPGPTEAYIWNYGTRVHHMAFAAENIEDTYTALQDSGMKFMTELLGSREQGLKQTFSRQSKKTLLVNEYIHRFDHFDGFFTKENVEDLTEATGKQ